MANDYTTTITLDGDDKTGAMWKSATKGSQDYIKNLERILQLDELSAKALQRRAKDNKRSYQELLETILKNNKAYNEANGFSQNANQNGAAAANKHKSALKGVADELAGMATRWISVTAAANAAKQAFVNYAEGERKLLVLQNKYKATTQEIRNSEAALKDVARTTKTTFDESLDAATKLKGGLGVTLDQAIAKTTRLNIVAKGLAVIPQDLAEITTDIMRTMNIPANEFEQTMEMVAGLVTELGLDLHQLKGQSDQLGETAKMAGLKGREGFAEMAVELGIANKEFGGTIKGARVLQSLMSELGAAKTGEAFNIPGPKWISEVEQFKKGGGNAVVYAIGKFKQLRTEEERRQFLLKLGERDRLLFSSLVEKDNGQIGKQIELMQRLASGQRGVEGGKRVWESSAGAVDDLTTSIKLLSDEFGHLMEVMGVPQVISMITKEFERLGKVIQWVEQWGDWWNGKAKRPPIIGPHGLHMPKMGDLATGMRQGLTGQGGGYDLEARKRLDENLKKGDATTIGPPVAKPMSYQGGGGIPPGYQRVSNTEAGETEDSLLRRGAVWIAGKLYLPKSNKVEPSGMGIRGALPSNVHQASYGSSADSMYLPADYRSLAQRAGGGGGGGGGAPITGGQGGGAAAGPAGPGVGTGYGPDGGALIGGGGSGGNQMPVTAGPANQTGGVPSAILAKAQEVAAAGGPGAVDQFMRSQGYPKAGAWCGQFAASVVKASGGTPPANPQVASNWRNFGTKVDTPQPGDIAVKVGSRFGGGRTATGATGSHVTVVSSVGKGTFAGLGGNQGGGRLTTSNFNQGAYEYFRGGAQGAASAAASPGGFAPQGGAPSGALNQDAYAQMFGGTKLAGQEEAIKAAAAKHNISPALLAGIIAHESGKGTSRFTNQLNNPAGIMDKNTNWMKGKQFGSIGEGIDASARTIAKNLARGGGTIEGMGKLYAPPGAANDPRGLNSGWAAGVRKYMGQLGGGALGGGGATDMSAQSRLAMTPEQIARGTPMGGDAAAAGKSEQLRRMGFVYDPDTGAPLRKFDPYTGSKLAAPTEGVAGSAAGGIHPGIAAERERRKQEETSKDITREKQLRKEISDTQNEGIAGRKNKYGGEAAPQGGANRLGYGGEAIRTRPRSGGGVGGEAAPMGGARRVGGGHRVGPRTAGVGGEAAPEGGMPEPPHIAQARRQRELQEITERQEARREQTRTDDMNQRARDAGKLIGRGAEPSEAAPSRSNQSDQQMNVNLKVNDAQVQFARSSMRRAADREVREARWSSYSDIGAA